MSDINKVPLAGLEKKLSSSDDNFSILNQHIVELESRVANLAENITQMKSSTSWKITAPFRRIKLFFTALKVSKSTTVSKVNSVAVPLMLAVEEKVQLVEPEISKKEFTLDIYDQDGLTTIHNHEFMSNEKFVLAYQRGVKASGLDYGWHWRVHIGLWAAQCASKLSGDFVECGVNKGFLSSSIMQLLNWDSLGKTFYLLDTFEGIDKRYITSSELDSGILDKNKKMLDTGWYVDNSLEVRENFSEWRNLKIIEGVIPETLSEVKAEKIAYLHIDLNCAPPEVAALDHLWDRIVPGGFILLDDYAYSGYREQKIEMDKLAKIRGFEIASLPTGQGLIVKT